MDFLSSALIVLQVTLGYFLFSKRYSFKNLLLVITFYIDFLFSQLFFFFFFLIHSWYKTDLCHPFWIHTKSNITCIFVILKKFHRFLILLWIWKRFVDFKFFSGFEKKLLISTFFVDLKKISQSETFLSLKTIYLFKK